MSERPGGHWAIFQCLMVPQVLRVHAGAGEAIHGAEGARRRPVGGCLGFPVPRGKGNKVLQLDDATVVNVAQC